MHQSSILRMKWFVDHYTSKISKSQVKVLDVGSYDVNGSYKPLFAEKKYLYTGLDMEDGSNVDLVLENAYDWDAIATDSFDVVISGQAIEHIEFFVDHHVGNDEGLKERWTFMPDCTKWIS